jgi:hypothetical protein
LAKEPKDASAGVGQREYTWLTEFYEKWVAPDWSDREADQRGEADTAWTRLCQARTDLSEALAAGDSEGSPFVAVLREFAFAEAMYDRVVRRSGAAGTPGEASAGRVDGFVDGFEAGFELAHFLASQR